ncbi:class I SAM-dependent DNA methyltransferase [Tessaracoccus rhinocerotis]|uniref:site-specific DNA-methyltransferase (adenine-specific) n=1 Tax=Tessaracoccus rhinocerotis TaxID=1689449 RepID=A0A553JZN3_9ACTN|nr:class I SAM-dependent DNA methyltransferase [Tessaracoccus rhinocerotis]TRY17910.1 class I SAM-dependent DNA methyltransferase [Tessaracoccus rhinocerotis]
MADSDALLVVEDWISEHFFTTDARKESYLARVLDRVKQWRDAEHPTTKSRFTAERSKLATAMAALYADDDPDPDAAAALHADLRRILGYEPGPYETTVNGPVRLLRSPGLEPTLALVEAKPAATLDELFARHAETLAEPYVVDDEDPITSATKLVSTLFLDHEETKFALIMAGRWLVVAEASRWPEGRYLAVDLHTVAERGDTKQGGEIDRALVAVDAESLAPDADGNIWWDATLEASVAHTVGVSADLREGVRESIELIANEVVDRRRAQGLDPLPQSQAQPLALQSLRFLYRILFLLYAEASPELKILPVGDPDYARGYSLDRLRELVQVELASPRARSGTHLYESLALLFRLVDRGHSLVEERGSEATERLETYETTNDRLVERGLEFQPLRADLFSPQATSLIDEVGLGNHALQEVLRRLLLSKERSGKERGFISYVELGINQLGAVYEGLMSYTGSFADVDLYEVARDGNPEKGSWVVPVDRADHLADKDFVLDTDPVTGQRSRRRYTRGQFVFRLSGRQRQRSASYYTPEVLTKFTVSEALAELLDQDGHTTTAEEILGLSVCEPALGSGAFAIEAVRQLAEQYLKRRQEELGERIDPDLYPAELQKVKAYLALHNVYGVDLNATAVEFAEITLWLDTMAEGLQAPWFGLRLRRGNSLVGASRSFYTRDQVNDKRWLTTPPTAEPLTDIAARIEQDRPELSGSGGRIHHWLLPAAGWGATSESKEAKELVPDRVAKVKAWRKAIKGKPTKKQLDQLVAISHEAEELWAMAYRRLMVAEQQSARQIPLWGMPQDVANQHQATVVTREQIEESLSDDDGAYRRLRRMMDAWTALWFWPLTGDDVAPPTLDQWIDAAQGILGTQKLSSRGSKQGMGTLSPADQWEAMADQESFELAGAGARRVGDVLDDHPWLRVCEDVAREQGFFHWQLDFATVFGRGGFDLQVGNPPWVRPDVNVDALLAESDPWWQLALKPSESVKFSRRTETLQSLRAGDIVTAGAAEMVALRTFVGDVTTYAELFGLRPDLYRCFMAQTWAHSSRRGTVGLIHPETHLTDDKAGGLRERTYRRLRRHWQFVNELQLFDEVHNLVNYGVHVYGATRGVSFLNAAGLYHPDTVARSLKHDGSGEEPGLKYEGQWDLRPHGSRIQSVSDVTLTVWRDILEGAEAPSSTARMLYTSNHSTAKVMAHLARARRVGSLGLQFSQGWNETTDRQKGRFVQEWGPASWGDAILQGPHLHVGNPFFKSPNPTMSSNKDWSVVDLETLAADALPTTAYKPTGDSDVYDAAYGKWNGSSQRDDFRVAWRGMAANTGERTLMPAVIPPGAAHIFTLYCLGGGPNPSVVLAAAAMSSMLNDALVRALPKSGIIQSTAMQLALPPSDHPLIPRLLLRTLRLNCVTDAYSDLWREVWDPAFVEDEWLLGKAYRDAPGLGGVGPEWTPHTPLRRDVDRRNALVEIDALMATMLGVTADELATIYRTQFAVLLGYDQNDYIYDANGRLIPTQVRQLWRKKGDNLTEDERTATHPAGVVYTYELPFAPRDREADFRVAMSALEKGLNP